MICDKVLIKLIVSKFVILKNKTMTPSTNMDTLSERMNDLKSKGYREEFKISVFSKDE